MTTSAPHKTIYLDINHWYMLGAAAAGHPHQPDHVRVLNQLTQLANDEKVTFPLSAIHYMELTENPRDILRAEAARVMARLSQFKTMTTTSKIIDEELATAFNRKFGRPAFPVKINKFGQGATFAFGEPTTIRLTGGGVDDHRLLEAKLGMSIAELEKQVNVWAEYQLLYGPSASMAAQIPNYDRNAARRVADRDLASFNIMVNTLRTNPQIAKRPLDAICARQFAMDFIDNYTRATIDAGFTRNRQPFHTKEEYTDFLMSLPSRRVASMMQFHYLKDVQRNWTINDLRDIAALAISIPYCDVVVTDNKACDTAKNRAHLDREFGTAIFSQLTDVSNYLAKET